MVRLMTAATGQQIWLLLTMLAGPDRQVVYLARIAKTPAGQQQSLVRRQQHALCRITSPVRLETVQGEEITDEVIRVAQVVLTEDV